MRSLKFSVVLGAVVLSTLSWAQGELANLPSSTSTRKIESFKLANWKKNLKVTYFGDYTATTLKKWDDNVYSSSGVRTNRPVNLYNELNTQYQFSDNWSLFTRATFSYQIGDRNELSDTDDQSVISMGDSLVGVLYTIFRNKNVIYNGRVTHKQSTSDYSKSIDQKSELEYRNFVIWFPTYTSTILIWNSYRFYVYGDENDQERYRINNRVIYNYSFNDTWGMQMMSEFVLQHRASKEGPGTRKWNHFEKYKSSVALGATYKVLNRRLTLIPNIEAQNYEDIRPETLQFGVTLLGKIF